MVSRNRSLALRLSVAVVGMFLLFGLPMTATVSSPAHAAPGEPAELAIQIDLFVGLDFVEFWWDATQIPGCASVDVRRDGQALTTLPCSTQPWRDTDLSPGTAYTYRFYFLDGEGKAIEPLGTGGYAAPGAYDGILHSNLTINNLAAPVKQIRVSAGGILQIASGAVLQGGSITDDAALGTSTSDACSATPGRVTAVGAELQDTTLTLCNADSSLLGNDGSATVYLLAAATVQENTLAAVYVNTQGPGTEVVLQGNHFPTGRVQVNEQSNVRIEDCDFEGTHEYGAVHFRHQSTGEVASSRFGRAQSGTETSPPSAAPSTAILVETTGDVHLHGNEIRLDSSADTARGIGILLQANPDRAPRFTVEDNLILGQGSGSAIAVQGRESDGTATLLFDRNVLSRFAYGVRLDDGSGLGYDMRVAATLGENSIIDNAKAGVVTMLRKGLDNDSVDLHNNCIANNGYGLQCNNPDSIVDATGNYWGHADGPSHTSNPTGQGDLVLCPQEQVDISAWLANHSCTVVGMAIQGIEVVQAVQTLTNSVPLVAGKPTVVRVYPGVVTGVANGVSGELTAYRSGAALGTLAHDSSIQAGVITDWMTTRLDTEASLNFHLPPAWLDGRLDLVATLDVPTANDTRATTIMSTDPLTQTVTVEFSPRRPFRIAYIPVTVSTGSTQYPVNAGDILDIHSALSAIFPLGDVPYAILPEATVYYHTLPISSRTGQLIGEEFLHYSRLVKRNAQEAGDFDADLYLTVIGLDWADSLAHVIHNDLSLAQCTTAGGGSGCLWIVGRNLNLRTVMDGDLQYNTPSQPSYLWPYADATTHEVGYDVQHDLVMEPDRWDLMYSKALMENLASWISPFHYQRAFETLAEDTPTATVQTIAAQQATATQTAAGIALWVTGLAGEQDGLLYPVQHVDGTPPSVTPSNPSGAICVQALNEAGAILDSTCFDPVGENPVSGATAAYTPFSVLLSSNAAIRTIRLRHSGTTQAQIPVPEAPPVIQLQTARYDASMRALTIAWTIAQGDAGSLRTTFLYSRDDGATWQPLAVHVHPDNTNYVNEAYQWGVRAEQIPPSSQARVRVEVTDGYHTTSATSDRFTLPDLGPWVGINAPAQNATVTTLPLTLQGFAFDVADAVAQTGDRRASIVWRSDLDGELGRGATVDVATLSHGTHTITLSATDAAGNASQAAVRVTYQDGTSPPEDYTLYLPTAIQE